MKLKKIILTLLILSSSLCITSCDAEEIRNIKRGNIYFKYLEDSIYVETHTNIIYYIDPRHMSVLYDSDGFAMTYDDYIELANTKEMPYD